MADEATKGKMPLKWNGVIALIALLAAPDEVAAQAATTFVRTDLGRSEIHRPNEGGTLVAIRFGGATPSGIVAVDGGPVFSTADDGFFAFEGGIEVRLRPHARLTPFLGAGTGLLREPGFIGGMLRLSAGIGVNFYTVALRIGLERARHGGAVGPNVAFAGVEYRFGSE